MTALISNSLADLGAMLDMVSEGSPVLPETAEDAAVVVAAENTSEVKDPRGRKHTFGENMDNMEAIAKTLLDFDEKRPSLYHIRQLADAGFVDVSKGVQVHSRGRKPFIYSVSEAGKNLIASLFQGPKEPEEEQASV